MTARARLFERLVRNSKIPPGQNDQGVLALDRARTSRNGRSTEYPRININVMGKRVTVAGHRLACVLPEIDEEATEAEVYFTLMLYTLFEFEADHHLCEESLCVNQDHIQWLTKDEHLEVTRNRSQGFWARRRAA